MAAWYPSFEFDRAKIPLAIAAIKKIAMKDNKYFNIFILQNCVATRNSLPILEAQEQALFFQNSSYHSDSDGSYYLGDGRRCLDCARRKHKAW